MGDYTAAGLDEKGKHKAGETFSRKTGQKALKGRKGDDANVTRPGNDHVNKGKCHVAMLSKRRQHDLIFICIFKLLFIHIHKD